MFEEVDWIMELLKWDVYEVSSKGEPLVKAKFRGMMRKFGLENDINVLVENSVDDEGRVRFAIISGSEDVDKIKEFILKMKPSAKIESQLTGVVNPVLSKIKCNIKERYDIC